MHERDSRETRASDEGQRVPAGTDTSLSLAEAGQDEETPDRPKVEGSEAGYDEFAQPSRLKNAFWITGYAMVCGALLAVFSSFTGLGLLRFAFSLGALLLGIRFFRRFEKVSQRVIFVALSLVFFCLAIVVITFALIVQGQIELPAAP
ncbi:hypothetical protein IDH44_13180 [Paenibacillus sp. IB182496]|uniref:Uncharacterized protein n=1 Tax=Paenibacillus sabuli TaxID=2772509 RepID=A0A927GSY4_9BACL|nr:hypothetical protein [Paenibacillus sabuli]MBD2846152.1 hypothetical protein [Paenibacillus sabuli]